MHVYMYVHTGVCNVRSQLSQLSLLFVCLCVPAVYVYTCLSGITLVPMLHVRACVWKAVSWHGQVVTPVSTSRVPDTLQALQETESLCCYFLSDIF